MKLLVLVTDAFGGRGGIAKFNRDLLTAICAYPGCSEVIAVPRVIVDPPGPLPPRLDFRLQGAGGKRQFVQSVLAAAVRESALSGVICGHLNLLPLAAAAARLRRVPLVLIIYGIDAWQPAKSKFANYSVRYIDDFVTVSETTKRRFLKWSGLDPKLGRIVPPSIDMTSFHPGPKRADLIERYGLAGRKVLMTVGRLVARERYKGFDETLSVLPSLLLREPNLSYMIVGEGDDRGRLESRACELGVRNQVVFTGYISESEKVDHYRLADVYIMPSRGEGFGIVFLEAMACGIPVIASLADASREAVRDGTLGRVVNPDSPEEICNAVLQSLKFSERRVPAGLEHFSYDRFVVRWHNVVDRVFGRSLNTGS